MSASGHFARPPKWFVVVILVELTASALANIGIEIFAQHGDRDWPLVYALSSVSLLVWLAFFGARA